MLKSVLITGASGGIGQALCQTFKEDDYFVIATDRIDGTCECDAFIRADIGLLCTDSNSQKQFFAEVRSYLHDQSLFALINNAAVQILGKTENIQISDWQQTLSVNLLAPFTLIQELLPELQNGKGSVVNISSIHATNTKPNFVCYATSKTALIGLTQSMAVDLGSKIRINAICPAATATPMLMAGFEEKEEEFERLSDMHPLGRIAQSKEIAEAALFLTSPHASFITGTFLNVDGGIGVRLHDPD